MGGALKVEKNKLSAGLIKLRSEKNLLDSATLKLLLLVANFLASEVPTFVFFNPTSSERDHFEKFS